MFRKEIHKILGLNMVYILILMYTICQYFILPVFWPMMGIVNMQQKRLDYLDMVKGIGILLVVLGHMEDISTELRIWISSFHMPLFFIVSGILIAVKNEQDSDFSKILYKKWKGIIVPYLWFSLSYFVIDIANVTIIGNIDTRTFIVDTISSLTFYGMSVLWFLPALFVSSVSFIYLKKKLSDKIVLPALLVIAVTAYIIKIEFAKIYDMNADSLLITSLINIVYIFLRAWIAMSYLGYAFYIRKWYEAQVNGNEKFKTLDNRIFYLLVGIVLLVINIVVGMKNQCVDLRNILLNNVLLYYLAAFTGSFAIISICKAIPKINIITYFGKNSIIVMACHVNYYILYAGIRFAWIVDRVITRAKHYVFVAVTVTTVFVLSIIVIEAINRIFPFVIGKPFTLIKRKQQ